MVRLIGLRCVSFRDGARRSVDSAGRRLGLLDDIGAVKQGELGARPKWDKLAFGMGTRCAALRTAPRLCGKLRRRLLTRGIAPGCPQCRPRKSLSRPREAKTLISARLGDQAALSKMFFILVLIGAVISVVSFCAIPVRCRVCSASASICLRACSVDNSTNADGVFTPST